jgi:hypothetical protein
MSRGAKHDRSEAGAGGPVRSDHDAVRERGVERRDHRRGHPPDALPRADHHHRPAVPRDLAAVAIAQHERVAVAREAACDAGPGIDGRERGGEARARVGSKRVGHDHAWTVPRGAAISTPWSRRRPKSSPAHPLTS